MIWREEKCENKEKVTEWIPFNPRATISIQQKRVGGRQIPWAHLPTFTFVPGIRDSWTRTDWPRTGTGPKQIKNLGLDRTRARKKSNFGPDEDQRKFSILGPDQFWAVRGSLSGWVWGTFGQFSGHFWFRLIRMFLAKIELIFWYLKNAEFFET